MTYKVRAVSVSWGGTAASFADAPEAACAVPAIAIPDVTGLGLEGTVGTIWSGRKFAVVFDALVGGVDPATVYTVIELWTGGVLRRTISPVKTNRWEYNYGDGFDASLDAQIVAAAGAVTIKAYRKNAYGVTGNAAQISITHGSPATPTGLTPQAITRGALFTWDKSSEAAFAKYQVRTKVGTGTWSGWTDWGNNNFYRELTPAEITTYGNTPTIYIDVKAVGLFTQESGAASSSVAALPLGAAVTDINDFAITASKIFTKIPILEGDTWTDNSPSAGYVAWNQHNLYYNGVKYTIAAGNTNKKYIYWTSGGAYTMSDTNPVLSDGQFVIATNISGSHDLAWNAIANQVIGSAHIQYAAIVDAHVQNLSAGKLTSGSIISQVITLALTDGTGDVAIKAGKSDFGDTAAGFILGIDDSDSNKAKFEIGDASKYLKWDGAALSMRGVFKTADSGQRVELSDVNNRLTFYDSAGAEEITIGSYVSYGWAQAAHAIFRGSGGVGPACGIHTLTSSDGFGFGLTCDGAGHIAVMVLSNSTASGGYAGTGIYIKTQGRTWYPSGPMSYCAEPLVIEPGPNAGAPTHTASKGTLWVDSNGDLYINKGSTFWVKIG